MDFKIGSINLSNLKDFKSIFYKKPERLGLEIDDRVVRIVRVKKKHDGRYTVHSFGSLDIDISHANPIELQRFKSAIAQLGEGLIRVAVNIDHQTLRVRKMIFPKMPEQDLLEAIRWNFREFVEGNIDKYRVGFSLIDESAETNKMSIIAYGISEETVNERMAFLKNLGFKVVSLEPSSTALLAAFHANGILSDGKYHICVSFGDSISELCVFCNTSILFSRPLAGINEDSLIQIIMHDMNLEEGDARRVFSNWVIRREIGSEGQAEPINTAMGRFLSHLVVEVQRSIDAFCLMYSVDRVNDIYVCGSGANYPGLVSHMTKTLGVETNIFNPFIELLEPSRLTADVAEKAPLFAVATGLAIP